MADHIDRHPLLALVDPDELLLLHGRGKNDGAVSDGTSTFRGFACAPLDATIASGRGFVPLGVGEARPPKRKPRPGRLAYAAPVTSQGSPLSRFRCGVAGTNQTNALAAAAELGARDLDDALRLVLLLGEDREKTPFRPLRRPLGLTVLRRRGRPPTGRGTRTPGRPERAA